MLYKNQKSWKEIESFLPKEYEFNSDYKPQEEHWNWKGNNIHLDTFRNPDARAKIICFHGVGTNGRQISMIVGGPLAKNGFETIMADMPVYGMTEVNPKMQITYDDWVQCGSSLVDEELKKDSRPVFLYGLSAGGMETYHIAAENGKVKGIIGMTFLDQREKQVQLTTASNKFWGITGAFLAKLSCAAGFGGFKIKMSIPSKMKTLVNNKECLKIMMDDPTSAGNKVTMKFLHSYITYTPDIEPEDFTVCPVLLTQPQKDGWTPQYLSDTFLDRIKRVPVTKKVLQNGSHYPIEKEALEDLQNHILSFLKEQLKTIHRE
ncbi:serine aminopeptidase domain-containing protein [Anaerostipes sp.]|uniref:serine aminopeptidase domain-containing protein n=1 Tax=Anaerostipes sp. TaxID=1872530 RepID=UPI0025C700DA|nr:alpha/beta hydrolase [Anaerostipes sp.]